MRLRLSERDRQRFGVGDLQFELSRITNREAIELQRLGYPTPEILGRKLAFRPVLDENGEPVTDVNGDPFLGTDYRAWTALIWLLLRRAGVETDPHTLEFDFPPELLPDENTEPEPDTEAIRGKDKARARSTT